MKTKKQKNRNNKRTGNNREITTEILREGE